MIPGLQDIYNDNSARLPKFSSLGDLLSGVINIIFYLAAFMAFFYILWGAFAYITAQGKKEDLAKARARITWAIIGLVIVFLAYIITQLVAGVFAPQGGLPF